MDAIEKRDASIENKLGANVLLEFDAIGVDQLEAVLRLRMADFLINRQEIDGRMRKGSFNLLSEMADVSSSYLHQFFKGKSICITNMNKLANHFNVKYIVINFPV
ncbi:hypothetical protein TW85_02575 [Marinomonas sp. S3726]|uniref:hypothetical protein n=1 Tax=Marinomonas sp. S3726 TaxID=579484 RepID=UPI0005FA01A3|nr:hypothetical protein [Marinomonas sp. S3726]KJZ15802.1 hypothetical protein TW85_02575 [Marinomonas sp. S3726]